MNLKEGTRRLALLITLRRSLLKAKHMLCPAHCVCLLAGALHASISPCQAVQKKTSEHPPAPGVSCSEKETAKSCSSFKQLLNARDKDLLDTISKKPAYVCFRPNDDAFQVFSVPIPSAHGWKQPDTDGKQEQEFESSAQLTEYRDGLFYEFHVGRAHWTRWVDSDPYFAYAGTTGRAEGLKISIDATEVSVEYPFTNQSGDKVQYSLSIRRSTGRFVETYRIGNTPGTTNSGTCMIYR